MRSAPNFTTACVVMFGVNLIWVLAVILVVYGFLIALLACVALHYALDWLAAWRLERQRAAIRRGKSA